MEGKNAPEGQEILSLQDYYIRVVRKNAVRLEKITHNLVGDAAFSNRHFVDAVTGLGFTFISRLRKDTTLRYVYSGGYPFTNSGDTRSLRR